jgi:hypothetical protein
VVDHRDAAGREAAVGMGQARPDLRRAPWSRPVRLGYLCADSFEDIVETLKDWGIVRGGLSVQ